MLKNYSKIVVNQYGDKNYISNKRYYHRLDGPAIENSVGSKFWYINGNRHRNIDPSCEYSNGINYWYFKGKPHRIGGSSCKEWYIDSNRYTKKQYFNIMWDI